jgi:hypothetical protein
MFCCAPSGHTKGFRFSVTQGGGNNATALRSALARFYDYRVAL